MAALPRKWVSGGAPTLESTSALVRGVDLKFGGEGFEVGAGNGRAVKVREFFGVDD